MGMDGWDISLTAPNNTRPPKKKFFHEGRPALRMPKTLF